MWNAVVGRAALRRNDNYSWRLITVPEDCADIEEFYRIYSDRRIPQEVVKDAFPDHFLATTWYVSTFPSSPRWPVEAWLLAGLSVQEVAAKVSPANPVLAVDVYRRAFFQLATNSVEIQDGCISTSGDLGCCIDRPFSITTWF